MTRLRAAFVPLVVLAVLGQSLGPVAGCVATAPAGPAGAMQPARTHHASERTCEADAHDPLCPLHRHVAPMGNMGAGDASCHIRAATATALAGLGLLAVPEPGFAWHAPPGTAGHAAVAADLLGRHPAVDLPPPRA